MKLSFLFFGNKPDEKWHLCRQMGIEYAIAKLAPELTGDKSIDDYETLARNKELFEANGFQLLGLEGDQMDMTNIKLGLEGRERDIDKYCQMLENMGKLDIKLLCYNFMYTGWYRTRKDLLERGDALVSGFNYKDALHEPNNKFAPISEEQIWENYKWFIQKVIPIAEANGVQMALHPDDPPISPIHGIGRIFTSSDAINKALLLINSPSHGLTFCQGTYVTMGHDVEKLIYEWGNQQKIFYVHIRDVKGSAEEFQETFHDNGPTDMFRMMKAYKSIGFNGPLRSDHVPTMYGEDNEHPGYEMRGNLFGIGYIKGLIDGLY